MIYNKEKWQHSNTQQQKKQLIDLFSFDNHIIPH